ncbi:MAG: sulfite exporter TauE/SafE family protein [Actinomycetota bacterium]|nr:sulfite exporter TauE/SafE family protein [Actinomycetota bacterium]
MLATSVPLVWKIVIIFVAGCAAGISNGIAGGGTFLSFPTLLALGIPSLTANMSSSVGILPSTFGGIRGFRHELKVHRTLLKELVPTCVLGSVAGTVLLLIGSNHTFSQVIPWLIGMATILFAVSPKVTKLLAKMDRANDPHAVRRRSLFVGIFIASVYGGYFGAGLGIVLLAVMALTLPYDINVLQGLRVALSLLINLIAGVVFIIRGHLALQAVLVLLAGALVGGWLGTILIRRLPPRFVRALVITIGTLTTVKLALGA